MLCATLHAVATPPRGGLTQALEVDDTMWELVDVGSDQSKSSITFTLQVIDSGEVQRFEIFLPLVFDIPPALALGKDTTTDAIQRVNDNAQAFARIAASLIGLRERNANGRIRILASDLSGLHL